MNNRQVLRLVLSQPSTLRLLVRRGDLVPAQYWTGVGGSGLGFHVGRQNVLDSNLFLERLE